MATDRTWTYLCHRPRDETTPPTCTEMPRSKQLAALTALDNVDFNEPLSEPDNDAALTTLPKQTRKKLFANRVTKPGRKARQPVTEAVAPTARRIPKAPAEIDQIRALDIHGDELVVAAYGFPPDFAEDIVAPKTRRITKIIKERPIDAIAASSPGARPGRKRTQEQLDRKASKKAASLLQVSNELVRAECSGKDLDQTASLRETEDFDSILDAFVTEASAWKEESSWPKSDGQKDIIVLRRRLGDLVQKYEKVVATYRDMRVIGLKEAELTFDKLERQSGDRAKAAAILVETLKTEVATQTGLAEEAHQLQIQLEYSSSQVSDLLANVSALNIALTDARADIKNLSAKLASRRTADVATTRVHGNALQPTTSLARHMSTEAYQIAQLREDLYADLTGMIIRGVKCGDTETVYDCIQTGINGTLHFKLSLATNTTSDSFQEAQFTYKPQLDVSRDVSLIDLLPDYLTEEIAFPRQHAAKFFARVTKALMENSA